MKNFGVNDLVADGLAELVAGDLFFDKVGWQIVRTLDVEIRNTGMLQIILGERNSLVVLKIVYHILHIHAVRDILGYRNCICISGHRPYY